MNGRRVCLDLAGSREVRDKRLDKREMHKSWACAMSSTLLKLPKKDTTATTEYVGFLSLVHGELVNLFCSKSPLRTSSTVRTTVPVLHSLSLSSEKACSLKVPQHMGYIATRTVRQGYSTVGRC